MWVSPPRSSIGTTPLVIQDRNLSLSAYLFLSTSAADHSRDALLIGLGQRTEGGQVHARRAQPVRERQLFFASSRFLAEWRQPVQGLQERTRFPFILSNPRHQLAPRAPASGLIHSDRIPPPRRL